MKLNPKIKQIPITDIVILSGNAKNHPRHQIDQLKKNIQRFGFSQPVMVSERMELIAGHGRLQAVTELGWGDVPAIIAEGTTTAEVRALRISDNRIADLGDTNESALAMELADLAKELEDGMDLDGLGFMSSELEELLDGFIGDDEDLFGGTDTGTDTGTDAAKPQKNTRVKERNTKQAPAKADTAKLNHDTTGNDDDVFNDPASKKFKCPKCNLVSVIE